MQKMTFLLSTAATLMIFAMPAKSYASGNAILNANNQLSVQYVSTYVNYAETANGSLFDTEKGIVPGFGFNFSLMGNNRLFDNGYLDIEMSKVKGHTNYVGSYIGSGLPYGSVGGSSGAQITDYSIRLGKGFFLGEHFMFTPFLELGHHRWYRGVNFGETYQHNYYGGGALAQVSFGSSFVLSVNGMIGKTYKPSIYVNFYYPYSFSANLGTSKIWRFGAKVDYAIAGGPLHINAGVDYMRFKYGASTPTAYTFYEPDSSTKYTTFKAGIGYGF